MKGHIRARGKRSFELKFDAGKDDKTGKRKIRYHSFRGTKRGAQQKLSELLASVNTGSYVEPNKISVADFVRARVTHWETAGDISARTAQRYRQLCEIQIAPHLGSKLIQKLRPLDIEEWHSTLRLRGKADGSGAAARTIGHAHRVLSKALNDAVRNETISRNACKAQTAPKVPDSEISIVRDIPSLLEKLEGEKLQPLAITALMTGMRLGELLALKWGRVDLDGKMLSVREAVEETKVSGIRFKTPKSKAGTRDITLPDYAVSALRQHWAKQSETRLQLGIGRPGETDLVFSDIEGNPLSPNNISSEWAHTASRVRIPEVTFHALRHTHASQLIDADVDIVTISKRMGHSKPDITLRIYAHLFRKDDSKAAVALNKVYSRGAND